MVNHDDPLPAAAVDPYLALPHGGSSKQIQELFSWASQTRGSSYFCLLTFRQVRNSMCASDRWSVDAERDSASQLPLEPRLAESIFFFFFKKKVKALSEYTFRKWKEL